MNPRKEIESLPARMEIKEKKIDVAISITESGRIKVDVLNSPEFEIGEEFKLGKNIRKLHGETSTGEPITLSNIVIDFKSNLPSLVRVNKISTPREVEIDKTNNTVSLEGEEVSIKFDVICLKHFHPYVDQDITLIDRNDWKAIATPLSNFKERIDFIKNYKTPIRTIEIRIKQKDISGDLSHQVEEAEKRLEKLLDLAGFVQGVQPSYIRAKVESIDDESLDSVNGGIKYKKYFSTLNNIGCTFSHMLVFGNEFTNYLDKAYNNYNRQVRNRLRLRMVLGYYWDAINSTRSVEAKFLSICSAIELLAKRHADLDGESTKTLKKIEYLIDKLNIETSDLADFSSTFHKSGSRVFSLNRSDYERHIKEAPISDELRNEFESRDYYLGKNAEISQQNEEWWIIFEDERKYRIDITENKIIVYWVSEKYFYSYTRQYVVHGDNNPNWNEMRDEFLATLPLLQRIIRNQLLSTQNIDDFDRLSNIEPNKIIDYE